MDSIGDNVMAIICVVVGILIIGCALVPIVDNASIETTTTVTETSGYNSIDDETHTGYPDWWLQPVSSINIIVTSSSITMNGEDYAQDNDIFVYSSIGGGLWMMIDVSERTVSIRSNFGTAATLSSGTITYANGTLTVTGTTSGNDSYTGSKSTATLFVTAPGLSFTADPTTVYGISDSPITIGEGQYCKWGSTVITTETTEPPSGVTMQSNEDGTATISFTSGTWYYGPYKWVGSITTTTTEESEYANLYAMIPVLCILGMAYVLIRRFY